ncbi:protein ORF13 [Pigeon adenovirus 1]
MPLFSPTPESVGSNAADLMIDSLFVEGVAHDLQWTSFSRTLFSEQDRRYILDALKPRFLKHVPLLEQLPALDAGSLASTFYDASLNWYFRLFQRDGYDALSVACVLARWLREQVNTLVLCGGRLSRAKLLFDTLARCFPTAILLDQLSSLDVLADAAPHAPLLCVPYLASPPGPLVTHLLEGNATHALVRGQPRFLPKSQFLVHCLDIAQAHHFVGRNVAVFFLPDAVQEGDECPSARVELRDFVARCSAVSPCLMSLHCKVDTPLCARCAARVG